MDHDVYRSATRERERERERENRRECIPVTGSRRTRVHQAYTHASSRGRVCVARAPHGNDESSTLEHLASCSFLSTFHRALSLTRRLSVTDPRTLSLSLSLTFSRSCPTPFRLRQPLRSCARDSVYTFYERHTEARRPRPCHDFAFVYALSLVTLSLSLSSSVRLSPTFH